MKIKCPICKRDFESEEGVIMLICPCCQINILRENKEVEDGRK